MTVPALSGHRVDRARLAVAAASAVALVLVAPFIGDIRDALRSALRDTSEAEKSSSSRES